MSDFEVRNGSYSFSKTKRKKKMGVIEVVAGAGAVHSISEAQIVSWREREMQIQGVFGRG